METIKNKKFQLTIGIAIGAVMFIIGTTATYTTNQNRVAERLCNLEDKMTVIAQTVDTLNQGKHADDLRYTEIKVKLVSIESTLAEIKNKLK